MDEEEGTEDRVQVDRPPMSASLPVASSDKGVRGMDDGERGEEEEAELDGEVKVRSGRGGKFVPMSIRITDVRQSRCLSRSRARYLNPRMVIE